MLKEKSMLEEMELQAYHAARGAVAVMDRSAWGRVRMTGEDRVDFLHRMSTNEVRDLGAGMCRQTVLTSDIARIVAVVTVYAFPDHLLLLSDPGSAERVVGHLGGYVFFGDNVQFSDVTEETGLLSLWGPRAKALLDTLAALDTSDLEAGTFAETEVGGVTAVVARADELELDGFNLIVERDDVEPLWERLVEAGAHPIDAPVYEVLRIEAGQPRHGHEMGEDFNPLEAGLRPIIDFEKGCYIGQEVVARLDTYDKVKQHLIGATLERLPVTDERPGLTSEGERVGFLTSWAESPAHGPIALGYVRSKHLEPNLAVEVEDAGGPISAQIVELPFS